MSSNMDGHTGRRIDLAVTLGGSEATSVALVAEGYGGKPAVLAQTFIPFGRSQDLREAIVAELAHAKSNGNTLGEVFVSYRGVVPIPQLPNVIRDSVLPAEIHSKAFQSKVAVHHTSADSTYYDHCASYARYFCMSEFFKDATIVVSKDFGTLGETLAGYKMHKGEMCLVRRRYGLSLSASMLMASTANCKNLDFSTWHSRNETVMSAAERWAKERMRYPKNFFVRKHEDMLTNPTAFVDTLHHLQLDLVSSVRSALGGEPYEEVLNAMTFQLSRYRVAALAECIDSMAFAELEINHKRPARIVLVMGETNTRDRLAILSYLRRHGRDVEVDFRGDCGGAAIGFCASSRQYSSEVEAC